MLNQKITIEVAKNEKLYVLSLPHLATYGEVYDVLTEMKSFIVAQINKEHEASKPKVEENSPEQE